LLADGTHANLVPAPIYFFQEMEVVKKGLPLLNLIGLLLE
jgi:hypothetical protein